MAVSRWPASAAAVVAVVASSPRCCAQCAIKFAHRAENTPKLVFLDLLGELCRGSAVGGAALGEYFRAYRHRGLVSEGRGALHAGKGGAFVQHEPSGAVSEPHVVQFPQSGGGEVGTRGGAALTVRTASEKSAEYGLLWAMWSALWAHRGLS